MSTTVSRQPTSRTRGSPTECCHDAECGAALRNNYYEGKRLTPDSFRVEQRYLVERRHLLNRAVYGWGVVYGYGITVEPADTVPIERRLEIEEGLAFDQFGRELVEVGNEGLRLKDVIVVDATGRRIADPGPAFATAQQAALRGGKAPCWLLSVHYAEQNVDPVTVTDSCRCEEHEWDHVCETVRYVLKLTSCEECCREQFCEPTCRCVPPCGIPVGRTDEPKLGTEARLRSEILPRRAPRCLCEHLTELEVEDECPRRLCEIDEPCAHVRVDLCHGVPLACVGAMLDDCNNWTFGPIVEACGPRRLVKRNDLLFDLIRGCDLTRIKEFGWERWHRSDDLVDFGTFASALGHYVPGRQQEQY
ncbi:MAG: hypothetical protein M3Z10_09030, partial [Gemmatimonadota bacterium]|nr:hypothetical protein [Gemmatimonadota bacterium]